MPIETHLHHAPLWSLVVVFGVNLALPLLLALGFVITGLRRDGDDRGAYLGLARWAVITAVVMQLLAVGYHARLWIGTSEDGTVTQHESIVDSRYPRCELTLQTAHGSLEIAVPQGHCRDLSPGTRVPIITVARSTTLAQVGQSATAHALLTLGLIPLMIVMVAAGVVRLTSR
ncbi:MAG: hypothetical protein AAGF11_17290 [Myxococcota bacterium]